jgi:hypothetical protein
LRSERGTGSAGCDGDLVRGLDSWNTFDTDKKLKKKAGQQTQETAVSFVGARL